jgi:hypothetical protein
MGFVMSRGPTTFRQRDVAAAIKAARAAGLTVERVEVDKSGKIVVITSSMPPPVPDNEAHPSNPWDALHAPDQT